MTAGDKIDGSAGDDTLSLTDSTTLPAASLNVAGAGISMASVEAVTIHTTGGLALDMSTWTGVARLNVTALGTAKVSATLAATTDASITYSGSGTTTVTGGREVFAAVKTASAGDIAVVGAALRSVILNGGAAASIDNLGSDGTSGSGTPLKSVTLESFADGVVTIKGAGLESLVLHNNYAPVKVTLVNPIPVHALQIYLGNAGYDLKGTRIINELADATAGSMNISTGWRSALTLATPALAKLTLTGSGELLLDVNAPVNGKLLTIDGSAATSNVTLERLGAGTRTMSTGSGNDTFTVVTATAKDDLASVGIDETITATISSGAGDDAVTVATTGNGKVFLDMGEGNDVVRIASRSGAETMAIALGSGNDTLLVAAGNHINASDTVDGGDGVDALDLRLVGAAKIWGFLRL